MAYVHGDTKRNFSKNLKNMKQEWIEKSKAENEKQKQEQKHHVKGIFRGGWGATPPRREGKHVP